MPDKRWSLTRPVSSCWGSAIQRYVHDETELKQTYPIQKKSLPLPYLRDHSHLRFRTAHTAAVMRVRDALMREWHDWFEVRLPADDG